MTSPFRVRLWDMGANRARGSLVAIIDDAADIGAAEYANEPGECFFTIPVNHPYIDEIAPLERHVEVSRRSSSGDYVPIWTGVMDDLDADEDEVVVYATDYLGSGELIVNGSGASYTSQKYSDIVSDRLSAMIGTDGYSPLAWMSVGSIDSTSETVTVIGPYAPILGWLKGVLDIYRAETSVRPVISVSPRTSPTEVIFQKNRGSDIDLTLEYGANVMRYRFAPNYRGLYTHVMGIGQRREGASILYSTQTYAAQSSYGRRQAPQVFLDVINQTSLDRRVKRAARRLGTPDNGIALEIGSGMLAPWDGYDLADSLTVRVIDGVVNLDTRYTVWGQEWIGMSDGSESLFLDLSPKET